MSAPVLLLLAAGSSSRMRGRDKLLEDVDGQPLLRRQAEAGIAANLRVVVTLPPDRPARLTALDGALVDIVVVDDAAEGIAASIRAGIAALPERATGAIVLPADMPDIGASDLSQLSRCHNDFPGHVFRGATALGEPGHPVLFPARLFPKLRQLTSDVGARALLKNESARLIALSGTAALTDLDTPEAWQTWRAKRNQG